MTEAQAKEQIVILAAEVDRIDGALRAVEKDIETLTGLHGRLVELYTKAADQIERIAGDIRNEELSQSVLKVTAAMKQKNTTSS